MFINIDGMDGSGKTTLIQSLKQDDNFKNFHFTREPGGTPLAETIRNLIMNHPMSQMTELLLFFAARTDHILMMQSKWNQGINVITDRYIASTFIYQNGIPRETIQSLMDIVQCPMPDLEILLDVDFDTSMKRKHKALDQNRMDMVSYKKYNKRREAMIKYAKTFPHVHLIDANGSPMETLNASMNILMSKIKSMH